MRRSLLTTHLAIIFSSATFLYADEKDTIGLTDLLTREPSLNGSNLRVALVEAQQNPANSGKYQPNPASASQPASKFSFFDTNNLYPAAGNYDSAKQSSHANLVANHYFDLNTGVATNVSEIYVFEANYFYNTLIQSGTNINSKVVNQSFVFGNINSLVDRNYDHYADQHQTLFVNGLGNGSAAITSPATSYNSIAVGREDLLHSSGPSDNRSKPEIIAPGTATSYATPYVSGSAAVLIEAASTPLEHGGTGTANTASDIRTIKALLLNGAVKDSSWSHSDTRPLDTRRGAGLLNINQSHLQLQGGKHNPTFSASVSSNTTPTPPNSQSGNVSSLIGWNFASITNSFFSSNDRVDNYYFDIPAGTSPLYDVTATLTWHRQNNQSEINNLDLILYNANSGAVIEQSISTIDNTEHIHTRDLPAGRYVIQVIKRKSGNVSLTEDYALAFDFSTPAPDAPSALTATAAPNLEIDLAWTDNSTDELHFELQRSTLSGRAFNTIATLPADTTTYTDTAPLTDTTYHYRVKATNTNGDSFYTNIANATATSNSAIMFWRQENFSSTADAGNSANSADPDHDGIDNLTEYALGTDPNSAAGNNGGSAQPKASIINLAGTDYLQLTITRAENKPDLDYTVQVSPNLQPAWTEATTILENTPTTLRVRDNLPVTNNTKRFIRLKVTEK